MAVHRCLRYVRGGNKQRLPLCVWQEPQLRRTTAAAPFGCHVSACGMPKHTAHRHNDILGDWTSMHACWLACVFAGVQGCSVCCAADMRQFCHVHSSGCWTRGPGCVQSNVRGSAQSFGCQIRLIGYKSGTLHVPAGNALVCSCLAVASHAPPFLVCVCFVMGVLRTVRRWWRCGRGRQLRGYVVVIRSAFSTLVCACGPFCAFGLRSVSLLASLQQTGLCVHGASLWLPLTSFDGCRGRAVLVGGACWPAVDLLLAYPLAACAPWAPLRVPLGALR